MKQFRILSMLMIVLISSLSFVSCGDDDDETSGDFSASIIARLSSKGLKHATNSLRMISLVNIRLGRKLQKQISKVSLMEMLLLMYWNNVLIW